MSVALLAVMGASGDLMDRYLAPALAELEAAGRLPDGMRVVGADRDPSSDAELRERIAGALDRHAEDVDRRARDRLLARLGSVQADATDPDDMARLEPPAGGVTVVYLALPPAVFADAVDALCAQPFADRLRIALEKPFGTDLESARALNRRLAEHFDERCVARIDHFVGHQTTRNLLGARFGNRVLTPLWHRAHVERIEIVWDETLAVEDRAGYYDETGALRDMVQNHLLQLMAFTAMGDPGTLDADSLRAAKSELLAQVYAPDPTSAGALTTRARYTAGTVDDRDVPAYVDEPDVDPERATETFAAVTLSVDDDRWEGVPFVLRTGKALREDRRVVRVRFREPEGPMFREPGGGTVRNALTFGIDPDHLTLELALSGPGDPFRLEPTPLHADLAPAELSPYAHVLADLLEGDPTFTVGPAEVEEQWRIVEPVLEGWAKDQPPLGEYRAGSDGPEA